MDNANILAIIPARGGSKGIPGKNIKTLNGKPLIHYPVELAREAQICGVITDHLVSTDDEEIALIAEQAGGNVPFIRPEELATDDSLVIHTLMHAVNWWEQQQRQALHSILILQATNPLTIPADIEGAVKHYLDNQPNAECLVSICSTPHIIRMPTLFFKNGLRLQHVEEGSNPSASRQSARKLYYLNGCIYITRRDLLMRQQRIVSDHSLYFSMPQSRSAAIDDLQDWSLAEYFARHNNSVESNT